MRRVHLLTLGVLGCALFTAFAMAAQEPTQVVMTPGGTLQKRIDISRPQYRIGIDVDYELLTFKSSAEITVPVVPGDSLKDVVFFIYANASAAPGHKYIAVDKVSLNEKSIPFKLNGSVLRATLPHATSTPVTLEIEYHGVVPRAPEGSGGLQDMVGALGTDIGSLLGGMLGGGASKTKAPEKPKNTDYGLYTYGNGILSLGAFWYPQLAVRQSGKWVDEAPSGLGDVAFAEMSDFSVSFKVPLGVKIAATGKQPFGHLESARPYTTPFVATNVREFPVLMSKDFAIKSKVFDVSGKKVEVSATVAKSHEAKADEAIEIAGHALQIFSKRFGPYPYESLKVVEGPMRGGAGGMEYSGLVVIASMLFDDMGKQIGGIGESLGLGNLDAVLGDVSTQDGAAANPAGDLAGGMLGQQKAVFDSLLETTIAHEVAHQWWAIGVGSDSQRAPWQDESLTNYSANIYFEDRYGKAKAQQMADLHLKGAYETARMLGTADAAANKPTAAYTGNLQYGAIVYGKGALFYGELRKLIGDEAFFKSLNQYYGEYSGKIAPPHALRQTFEKNASAKKAQIAALYARWIEDAHGDEDISGGQPASITDLLGGILGSVEQ